MTPSMLALSQLLGMPQEDVEQLLAIVKRRVAFELEREFRGWALALLREVGEDSPATRAASTEDLRRTIEARVRAARGGRSQS